MCIHCVIQSFWLSFPLWSRTMPRRKAAPMNLQMRADRTLCDVLRSLDWVSRHEIWAIMLDDIDFPRCDRIMNQMGPDELIMGMATASTVNEFHIIPLTAPPVSPQ